MRWILPLAVLFMAIPASAQEESGLDLDAEARARFDLAQVHLRNGRFVEAAHEFEEAYGLSQHYELLFNVHIAYRDAGEPRRAADALERYLAAAPPELEERANLEARLANLRRQEEEEAERGPAAGGTGASGHGARTPPSEDDSARGGPGALPFVVMGAGALALVGTAITGGVALGISNDLADRCVDRSCEPSLESDANTGRALAITADVLLGVGIAAVGVGVLLLILSSGDEETVTAGGACLADGCMASVRGRF